MQEQQRQIVLDTETTGMNQGAGPHYLGHKIIEIGCVEMINRKLTGRHFHVYIRPDRMVDEEAIAVHGITNEFLVDKPMFHEIVDDFVNFIRGAEIIAHNAPFDVGFMDYEFDKLPQSPGKTEDFCSVIDSLAVAKSKFPGQKNNLDALCKRLGIDNSHRELHGALLDAEILADVYLLMTGGQTSFNLASSENSGAESLGIRRLSAQRAPLKVLQASADEIEAHEARLDLVEKKGGKCLWRTSELETH